MVQTNDNSDLLVDLNLEPIQQPFRLAWTDLALSTRNLPPTSWLVPGLITVGESTLLIGAPKGGKTIFLLDLIRAMTQTGQFLGFNVPMGRVWLLSEFSPRTIRGQMGLLSFVPDEGIRTAYLSEQKIADMTPQGVIDDLDKSFNHAVQRNEVPSLIVWDTMGRWLTGQGKDFNAYGDMSAATMPLLRLFADMGHHDTSPLVAHHGNKSGRGGAESSLGSQALAGSFDNVINLRLIEKQSLNGPRYITVQGRNDTNDTFRDGALVKLFLPEGDLRLVDAVDISDIDERVLEAVQAGFDTRAKVEANTGETANVCRDSLNRLKDKGDISRLGQGKNTSYISAIHSFVT